MPSEIVVLLDSDPIEFEAQTFLPIDGQLPFLIETAETWDKLIMKGDDGQAKQTLKHELYHGVQIHYLGEPQTDKRASLCVLEGSAQYFSNVVYLRVNEEWCENAEYQHNLEIFNQPDVQSTELFFHSLEMARGVQYINDFVLSTDLQEWGLEERSRLSMLLGFTDDFYIFAYQLSLGKVKDTSGAFVDGSPREPWSSK